MNVIIRRPWEPIYRLCKRLPGRRTYKRFRKKKKNRVRACVSIMQRRGSALLYTRALTWPREMACRQAQELIVTSQPSERTTQKNPFF